MQMFTENALNSSSNHDDTIHDPVSNLNRNLASFGLSIDPVVGDGDCAFSSIVKQLHKLPEFINKEPYFVEHLYGLGLSKSVDLEEDAYRLRQLFVDNVQSNEEYQSVAGVNPDRLNEETELFRERGYLQRKSGGLSNELRFTQMCLTTNTISKKNMGKLYIVGKVK